MATMKSSKSTTQTTKAKPTASNGSSAFADRFKKVKEENPQGVFAKLPVGKWEASCSAGGVMEKDGNYLGWIDYTITESREVEGKDVEGMTGRAFFAIENDEAEIQVGAAILQRQLADMGYMDREEDFQSKEHIEELLGGIEANPCSVIIKVAAKKGYINIYLDSVVEAVNS